MSARTDQYTRVRRTGHRPKSRSKLAGLPSAIRVEMNRKLREGWTYALIIDWLFALKAENDVPALNLKAGDSYSAVWTRDSGCQGPARPTCEMTLSRWYHTEYQDWLKEEMDIEESLRLVERAEQLTNAASTHNRPKTHLGGNLFIRSLLLEAVQAIRKGDKNPDQIARLANAWARVSQVDEHTVDIGFETLLEEIKAKPEAVEAFHKLRAIVKGTEKQPKPEEPR